MDIPCLGTEIGIVWWAKFWVWMPSCNGNNGNMTFFLRDLILRDCLGWYGTYGVVGSGGVLISFYEVMV